jgi:hypothetical protein
MYNSITASRRVKIPTAYIIPMEFLSLIEIMQIHGIRIEQLQKETQLTVEQLTFERYSFAAKPYEGRARVDVSCTSSKKIATFPKGTFIIQTAQRTRRVITHLLEPESPDSFVAWGFFNAFFERKEYAEAYVMEPVAQNMLKASAGLRHEFEERMKEKAFRDDPAARLDFFYQRSPFFDINERKYPIYRLR